MHRRHCRINLYGRIKPVQKFIRLYHNESRDLEIFTELVSVQLKLLHYVNSVSPVKGKHTELLIKISTYDLTSSSQNGLMLSATKQIDMGVQGVPKVTVKTGTLGRVSDF